MHLSTIERWRSLEPTARRSLLWFLTKQLALCVALYAVIALSDHSWWRPAIALVVASVITSVVRWVDRRYGIVAQFRRRRR